MNYDHAEPLGWPWGAQVAQGMVEGPSRVPSRRERRRVRNVTHTMVWRTSASETIGFLVYFAHALTQRKVVQYKTEARQTLRRLWFRGHGRLF